MRRLAKLLSGAALLAAGAASALAQTSFRAEIARWAPVIKQTGARAE